jgi:hypothetical protein
MINKRYSATNAAKQCPNSHLDRSHVSAVSRIKTIFENSIRHFRQSKLQNTQYLGFSLTGIYRPSDVSQVDC